MSIIFDKGSENAPEDHVKSATTEGNPSNVSPTVSGNLPEIDDATAAAYANMDVDDSSATAASLMELDEQTQYQMLYGTMEYPTADTAALVAANPHSVYADANIESNPAQIVTNSIVADAVEVPASVLPTGMPSTIAEKSVAIPLPSEVPDNGTETDQNNDSNGSDSEAKRTQELDDMAMLGIDVGDMAAQCF